MENFEGKKTGGEAKIKEYINRIKAGESKEEITKDLPDYFKLKIEEGLQESENKNIENKITSDEFLEKRIKNNEEDKAKIEEIRKEIGLEKENNIEVKKGTKVSYQGKEWKIADIIPHKYETKDGEEKIVMVYNLERNDGYILENGGVTKYIYKDDFEIL